MKHKMKNLLKIGFLALGILLLNVSCSEESISNLELSEIKQIQNNFTLENFSNSFIKNNLDVDWTNYNQKVNNENSFLTYEFNTHLKVRSELEKFSVFKLIVYQDDDDLWNYEIIKFLSSNTNLPNELGYFKTKDFNGTVYHYNLKGENTIIKAYEKGVIIEKITLQDFTGINTLERAPAVGGTHCAGCWTLVRTNHYTDWYSNSGGGSTLYYSHSSYDGTTTEWVYIPPNNDYHGMPYDIDDASYHDHYNGPHAGGVGNNHNEEVILTQEEIDDIWSDIFPVDYGGNPIQNLVEYLKCFDLTQSAEITIYVDQPIPNSTDPYSYNLSISDPIDVGHTFIGINQNGITRYLGFYPTPNTINPTSGVITSAGLIRDNSDTEFDVSLSTNITPTQLANVHNLITNYSANYNLNTNNCTDFGNQVFNLIGISLPDTNGVWPYGGNGSNPGNLGQDIRNMTVPQGATRSTNNSNTQNNNGTCN
ncbi:hypothetical protein [Lacinutrix salivirga]